MTRPTLEQKVITVSAEEFLRRFLPKGLARIHRFGLFANRRRAPSLLRRRSLLGTPSSSKAACTKPYSRRPPCSEPMLVVERMTSCQLLFDAPSGCLTRRSLH